MPQRSKGPRLWLEPARTGRNQRSVWVIRDGRKKSSTGFGPGQATEAQEALARYILAKTGGPSRVGNRDPDQVNIVDVISIYLDDIVPKHVSPADTAWRLERILAYFGGMTLADLNKRTCAAYAAARGRNPSARRELADLRAAVRHHWQSGLCSGLTPVTMPPKSPPRERWLTRSEAARLIWAAWRHRDQRDGRPNHRYVARFILVALYTGTRAGAICGAAMAPTEGRSWVDLEHGVFYRRAIGRAETKKRQPPVRIPPRLLAHMRRWQRKKLAIRYLIENKGYPLTQINDGFKVVRKDAGLPDVCPHSLRHTCATWLMQRGVPVWEAAGYLGMSVEILEAHYGHHHPDHHGQAIAALGRRDAVPARNVVGMWKGSKQRAGGG